jgi:small subunit ribosomal protein S2
MAKVTIKDLLEAGVHFGHQTKRWNPNMKEYVFGARNGISIIDLTKTMKQLADSSNFLQHVIIDGGTILFVGTKRQAQELIKNSAEKTGMNYVSERWLGGTLTNNVTIRKSIAKMLDIDKTINSPEFNALKKKEQSAMNRKALKLHRDLDGIASMKRLPDAIVIVDVCHDHIAVAEAKKLKIPIVAITDTNANPEGISYPIPGNDDAVRAIKVIMDVLVESIKTANEIYQKKVVEEQEKAKAEKEAREAEKAKAKEEAEKARKEKKASAKKPAKKKVSAKKSSPAPKAAPPKREKVEEKKDEPVKKEPKVEEKKDEPVKKEPKVEEKKDEPVKKENK